MKALLLAAGLGTRLRPITDQTPKCLVPVRGRPLLAHWLDLLIPAGVSPVLVNLHYLAGQVEDFIAKSPHRDQIKTVLEPELLGTGGTLLANRRFFKDDPLMLIHADNYSIFDVDAFIRAHNSRPQDCPITMMTFETDTPQSCGIVELDRRGVVTAFHEKKADPPGNLANGAVYILEPGILDFLASLGEPVIDFSTQVLPDHVGRIFTFHNQGYHRDIGTPESLEKAQERL